MQPTRLVVPWIILLCVRVAYGVTIPVTTTSMDVADDGECSLVEAITSANTDLASGATPGECPAGSGADVIALASQATYMLSTIASSTGQGANGLPIVTTPITIHGDGATIRRDLDAPQFRIFQVNASGNLTLDAVTVRYGKATDTYTAGYGAPGGCIYAVGPLQLKNSIVRQCTAGDGIGSSSGGFGGGIYAEGTTLTIESSSIEGCQAGHGETEPGWGGGLYLLNMASTIRDTRIEINHAGDVMSGAGGPGGGLAAAGGTLDVIRSYIGNNVAGSSLSNTGSGSAGGHGGGINAALVTIQMEGSVVTANQTGTGLVLNGSGAGLWMQQSTMTAAHSLFTLNLIPDGYTPDGGSSSTPGLPGAGAGLFLLSSSLSLSGCVISHNRCGDGGTSVDFIHNGRDGGDGAAISANGVGMVSLASCVVADNTNGNGGDFLSIGGLAGGGGGGTISTGQNIELTVRDTVIRDNVAGHGGAAGQGIGGVGGLGGGLQTEGSVRIERSSLTGNRAGNGGNGLTGNEGGDGGAIHHRLSPLTLVNVTLSGNSAGNGGASLQAGVSGASGGSGGGVYTASATSLYNVTLSDNARGSGGAGMPNSGTAGVGGGLVVTSGTTTLRNTIVANSTGADCTTGGGSVVLSGSNLVEDNTCGATGGVDPRLAPLAHNGHATLSHALCLAAGVPHVGCAGPSAALDAGADAVCNGSEVEALDQRHAGRPAGDHCDLGSFESGSNSPVMVPFNVAARPGGNACVPVTLGKASGPASISNQMTLPGDLFSLTGTTINPGIGPSSAMGKDVGSTSIPGGSTLFTVSGGDTPLVAGLLYTATYALEPSTPTGSYPLNPTGGGSLVVTTCSGDCNGNGEVSLGEVQRCVNHLLGAPLCNFDNGTSCLVADANLNGEVSLGEVQQCVNRFLGACP